MTKTQTKIFLVSCRVELGGREFNSEVPVEAFGYDEAVSRVGEALISIGAKSFYVHSVQS